MSVFKCSSCEILRDEVKWLRENLREQSDRFQALTGTLSEVANNRAMEDELDVPETGVPEADEAVGDEAAWAEGELERKRIEVVSKGGRVRPDFPV
jgi:hypothetical protein